MKTNYSDQIYLMNNALLECALAEDIDSGTLTIFSSNKNKGIHYIVSTEVNPTTKQPVKVYFKKNFNKQLKQTQ